MGSNDNHSVEVQILNNTRNITLRNPKTYLDYGRCTETPKEELSPGSSGACRFLGSSSPRGVAGLLLYEAESFTLAIYFNNPTDNKFTTELGLELSPGKAHLGRLLDTYNRMSSGSYSSSRLDIQFDRGVVSRKHGTVQVSEGNVKVAASMSYSTESLLEVLLEEPEELGEAAGIENLCQEIMEKCRLSKKKHTLEM